MRWYYRFSLSFRDIEELLLERAVDEQGQELDILLQKHRDATAAQHFLSNWGPIPQHFALKGEKLGAAEHRSQLLARLASWQRWPLASQNPFAF